MSASPKPSRANRDLTLRPNDLITARECIAIVQHEKGPLLVEIASLTTRLNALETPWYVKLWRKVTAW